MGEHGRPLEKLIERQREELGENLETLADKARAVTDWRAQVDARPIRMLGIAAGGGAVVALFAGRRRSRRAPCEAVAEGPRRRSAVGVLARDIRMAVGGVAAAAAIEFLNEAIPGFGDHFHRSTDG
ncbi:MAG: hypothetical protein SGJ01_01070 [Gemmatimonadota bacterium]|nr:hypothetical protein [Gemmatimonadota bacterium]